MNVADGIDPIPRRGPEAGRPRALRATENPSPEHRDGSLEIGRSVSGGGRPGRPLARVALATLRVREERVVGHEELRGLMRPGQFVMHAPTPELPHHPTPIGVVDQRDT